MRRLECMEALTTRCDFPLAYGRDGRRQDWPASTDYIEVKVDTGGRPGSLGDDGSPAMLDADADIDALARVAGRPGGYLLFPHTADHQKLPFIGYAQLTPDHLALATDTRPLPTAGLGGLDSSLVLDKMFAFSHRMVESSEATTMVLRQALESNTQAMTALMAGGTKWLEAGAACIGVINGMEQLKLPESPVVDIEGLAAKLDSTIKSAAQPKSQMDWMKLIGMGMQMAQGFARSFLEQYKAAQQAAANAATARPAALPPATAQRAPTARAPITRAPVTQAKPESPQQTLAQKASPEDA